MKTGYHYTSLENWSHIEQVGLQPYLIRKPEFNELQASGILPMEIRGVWLWPEEPLGLSNVGNIIFQISSKRTLNVVKMKVLYKEKERLTGNDGSNVNLYHTGTISNDQQSSSLIYHSGEKGIIINRSINVDRISLIKVYNLVDLLS